MTDESWDASQSWDGGDSSVASGVARVGQGWEVTQGRGSVGDGSLGSQVRGTGGLHCWLIHGNNGSVGMSHELGVQVQRTSVPCAVGDRGSSMSRIASRSKSSMSITSRSQSRSSVGNSTLSRQVLSTGSLHCWLVHGNNGPIGMSHEPVERGRGDGGETRNNNQELHVCDA